MKRTIRILVLVVAILLWGAVGYTAWREVTHIRAAQERIVEQRTEIAAAEQEKTALEDDIQRVGDEMAALPDSVRPLYNGRVMRASQQIAKKQMHLDGLITRATKRIDNALEEQAAASRRMAARGFAAGIPALLLTIAFFAMRRWR